MVEYPIVVYEPKCWIVYVHIVPKEIRSSPEKDDYFDKYYVGITSRGSKNRWLKGKGYGDQGFFNSIKKYGWDNIKHVILVENISLSYASYLEIQFIRQLNSFGKHGYNQNGGGLGKYAYVEDLTGKIFGQMYVNNKIDFYRNSSGDPITVYDCICSCGRHQNLNNLQLKYRNNDYICCDECHKLTKHANLVEKYTSSNTFHSNNDELYISYKDSTIICDSKYYDIISKYTIAIDYKNGKSSRVRCYNTVLYNYKTNKTSYINLEKLLFGNDFDYIIHKDGNNLNYKYDNLFFVDTSTFTFYHHLLNNKDNVNYLIRTYIHNGVTKYFVENKIYKNYLQDEKPKRFFNIEEAINERNRLLNIIASNNTVLEYIVSKYYKI